MHKYKRVLTSALALLLCFLTVFSSAFAYTQQQATSGYPQPPTYKGGNNSNNTHTTYTDPVIVGYRFTCWRSTDYTVALEKGLIIDSATRLQYLKSHNEPGIKLGHSINIMCNAIDANGNRRTDYANGYNQTGLKMPHMLTNGEQTDFLDKISLAQLEQKTDASNKKKITHSTATGLMLMNYAGSTDGNFEDTDESSWVEFYEPLKALIDLGSNDQSQKDLSSVFKQEINRRNPLKLYSGYYTVNQWNKGYLNADADREGEFNNLHTYIYGFQSKTQMGTSLEGYDRSKGVVTISDVDYDGKDVLPFNQNPANVIDTDNPNTWTNRNATLIAYLCGLTPRYGVPAYGDDENAPLSDSEFGVYDYIIVEPIMMYYYYNTRYYVTASDTAILQAQSMRDKVGNKTDVWTSVYWDGYKLFDVCGKFPAVYGTYLYTESQYFGVDGVFNATKQNGYKTNAFQTSNSGLDISSIASDSHNHSGNANRKNQDSNGWNTYATVFTTKSGYTLFTGGDHKMDRSVTRKDMRIRDGQDSYFLAPYIAVESMIGAGVFMSGSNSASDSGLSANYTIIYHSNPNSGGANNKATVKQTVRDGSSSMKLWDYQTALSSQGLQPIGKIPTNYWTFTSGNNGYGIADNTLSTVTNTYPSSTKKGNGKIDITTIITGWSNVKKFFDTYGNYIPQTNTMEVHLYAAWNTKSLVTAIDRTYDSKTAQTLKDATLRDPSGSMWLTDADVLPKAISVVATKKGTLQVEDIIQLQKDTTTGYQWFQASGDTGNLDDASRDYYIVYSFDKTEIKDTDATAVENALNEIEQNGLLIYRNNAGKVQWTSDTKLFYFDYYTFSIEAPNCSIVATISDFPDSDNTITKQTSNGILQMKLVRGSHISYTVTPDYQQGYSFDTGVDFGQFRNWTNGDTSHILTNPTLSSSSQEKAAQRLRYKDIKVCKSCAYSWDTNIDCCTNCNGTDYHIPAKAVRMYYHDETTQKVEVLGKQQHQYIVRTGKTLRVIPCVDDKHYRAPFDNYFVDIVNVLTGQTYIYSATPMNGVIVIPAEAQGVVQQALAGDAQYHVLVSATDQSGRKHMQSITSAPIDTTQFSDGAEITVYVNYYTASIAIQSQSGGNHSGIGGNLFYTYKEQNDAEQAIANVPMTRYYPENPDCTLCADMSYMLAESVALKGLRLNITRDDNVDWYLTSATLNGISLDESIDEGNRYVQDSATDKYLTKLETEGVNSYHHSLEVTTPHHFALTVAPYHYIAAYLDNNQVNVDELGITADLHEITTDINGKNVLRGKYQQDVKSIGSIIAGNTKQHIDAGALTFTYNQDAVVYTNLYYYTVTTNADSGYTSTQISASNGINAGEKAYILSNHTNYSTFASCTTGNYKDVSESITNTLQYTASATLNGQNSYADTSVTGKITAYGSKVTKPTVFTSAQFPQGETTQISGIKAQSHLYWRSNQPRYTIKFIFRINSVPYDSLPSTINEQISLNGSNPLTFSTDASGNIIATGEAVAGSYNLYLNNLDTGMSYQVAESETNVYYIDFYTLRAAAGTGIAQVSIEPTDVGNAWNGTLPYYRNGKKFATTLAIWPKSMTNATKNINVDAIAKGEYIIYHDDGKRTIHHSADGYQFNRWDTKRPTTNISISYRRDAFGITSPLRNERIDASKINHATVIQAEATKDGTPIDIPTTPEHNSIYYGVKVRTFLDGRLVTPWENMSTSMTLNPTESYSAKLHNGVAPWATVLDMVESDGITPIPDPYKGKSASALLAPSQEFEQNVNINTEYFYSGSNAYIANQYAYIDAFYYTQTVQTRVNGVNTPPWSVNQYKEVLYKQLYKNVKVDTTKLVSVNEAGAFQTIMLKGMSLTVGGLPVANASAAAPDYRELYNNFAIIGNHAFTIPYYTVDMRAVCDASGTTINCTSLVLQFNGTSLKTSVPDDAPALVMAGEYEIVTSDDLSSVHTDECTQHNWFGWDVLSNEVFKLEYVDSGDGSHPYPVLTYTGESRPSTSVIAEKSTQSTTVSVNDETHLVARYGGSTAYTLTLHSQVYDENGKLITPANNPITMYRGDENGYKYYTIDGDVNKYSAGTYVNISAALDKQTIYYPADISVSFTLECPHCGETFAYDNAVKKCPFCEQKLNLHNVSSDTTRVVYYATSDSYGEVQKVIQEASRMTPDAAAEYFAKNHVIPMTCTATGKYTGTVLYSEDTYHLYVNGVKQGSSYDVINNKKKEFVWGAPHASNVTWEGTEGINGNNALSSTVYSDFHVIMDANREYTVYAHQSITGEVPTPEIIVDSLCVTIYTATDYKTQLPYSTTHVYVNGVQMELDAADGHTFMMAKGEHLHLQAQRSQSGAYCDVYSNTIDARKTFLLSYNTVTVSGDKNLTVGINGTDSQRETWLAHYAIDDGAFQSANTQYSIQADGGNITNKEFLHMDATITITASVQNTLQLVAVNRPLQDSEELIGTFEGTSRTQYLYILENNAANFEKLPQYYLSQHDSVVEKYIIGFSPDTSIPNNLAQNNPMVNFQAGVKYNVIVDWNKMKDIVDWSGTEGSPVSVVAEEGTRFSAGSDNNNEYVFHNVPNGQYEIHMNGSLLITRPNDIKNATGAVSVKDRFIVVKTNTTAKTSHSTAFSYWAYDNTPGIAATTTALKGTKVNGNVYAKKRTTILDGTINYNARSKGVPPPPSGSSTGSAILPYITAYKVQVYLDDKLYTPFPKPVKFNGTQILVEDGESDILYSSTFPTVSAVADSHDNGYTEVYGDNACKSITYDAKTKTFNVYYYSVTYSFTPPELGSIITSNLCESESPSAQCCCQTAETGECDQMHMTREECSESCTTDCPCFTAVTAVAKGSRVMNGGLINNTDPNNPVYDATLYVGNHNRVAAPLQIPGKTSIFMGWSEHGSGELPTAITEPSHFIAHFGQPYGDDEKPYTVTLHNKSESLTGSVRDLVTNTGISTQYYLISKTTMLHGKNASVIGNAPNTIADIYLYGEKSAMIANTAKPHMTGSTKQDVDITINLTGYTAELPHKVVLQNTSTKEEYTCNVAANSHVASFNDVPSGYYQLYVDDIKYVTPFSYNTHADSCKLTSASGVIQTPKYETQPGAGGILYVSSAYHMRYSEVSHWSQTRYNRLTGDTVEYTNVDNCLDERCSGYGHHAQCSSYENWMQLDSSRRPTTISYTYICNTCNTEFVHLTDWSNTKPKNCSNCNSIYIRMTSSTLESPEIDEDLEYHVYSTFKIFSFSPLDINVDVDLTYPVYVQSVVDNVQQYPFFENGVQIPNAKAFIEYSIDNQNWVRMESAFDNSGLAVFYVPIGTTYRIVGAHADEWSMDRTEDNITDGGFALTQQYSTIGLDTKTIDGQRYIIGDGDYDNNNELDEPGIQYYVHYYTVTANAGHGIDDVNVHNTLDDQKHPDIDSGTVTATYQRGATARVSAALADGYRPVRIRLTRNNETYLGRNVWLSLAPVVNTETYPLTYNEETGCYENDKVFGAATGTMYCVWADGKLVDGVRTMEYTGVRVIVKPYTEPVTWSGNCKHDVHSQEYNPDENCDGICNQSDVNHISINDAPFTHSFVVYHTIVEQADAKDNDTEYAYRYADDHPLDPDDPEYDPEDPDNYPDNPDNPNDDPDDNHRDNYPENTVYYYTLVVDGDAGTQQAVGSGTYLEGATPNVNIGIQPIRQNIGRSPLTVTLYLDDTVWKNQTVTIGGYPAYEIQDGVYQTQHHFASGKYAVRVTSANSTLIKNSDGTDIYGYIELSSYRAYIWKAWTDGHVVCSECGITGACCEMDGTPAPCTSRLCTNCHIVLDNNKAEQSCCTTGDENHTWTVCPYHGAVYSGDCLVNLGNAQTIKSNTITMKHDSYLHGVTTHVDKFNTAGDTTIQFNTLRLHGDAGVDYVDISNGQSTNQYQESETITRHGRTAWTSTVFHRGLPERLWTDTRYERTLFQEVVVLQDNTVQFNAGLKQPVKNHHEAKTAMSVELTLDGKPYTGRTVTIGGYSATDDNNDGIYVTSYAGFAGGKTYQLVVDGRPAGRLYLESTRSYRWYTWDEPWEFEGDLDSAEEDAHYCYHHQTTHKCAKCLSHLNPDTRTTYGWYKNHTSVEVSDCFSYIARTQMIDEFHIYVDPNQDGGPDPYTPAPGDPDDPYQDPTDPDYPSNDPEDWAPGNNPEDNPNPEYNPEHKPEDNPEYDPVNPKPAVDPEDEPDDFDPDDPDDGFYEDAPVPFYTLTINTRLDDDITDDFPVKFENLTSGETIYIIPDGQNYHVYDSKGKPITDVPYIVSLVDGTVNIVLQDGDQYRISALDEIEDRKNYDDVVNIDDIKLNSLSSYTYTVYTTGAIKKAPSVVNVDFYTFILQVFSDGVQKLPDGPSANGESLSDDMLQLSFESPVWLDDVHPYQDGAPDWRGEIYKGDDYIADDEYYAVQDANTVKVYLKGQPYDVNVKTADDDIKDRFQEVGEGYLIDFQDGIVDKKTIVTVEYFSMTVDHHGGFTGTQINYGGNTHVSAKTPAGATSNAIAKAFFLKDTTISIDATVATNNTWHQWTGTATYSTKNQQSIKMNQKRTESAWAKTYYIVRYFLHDKHEGWHEVVEDGWTSKSDLTIIDNRNWNSETITGEPNKYMNFDPFRTHSFSDPNASTPITLRDVVANGIKNTTIDVVVNANQVGGQSFVDFYYTRNGSVVDPTPDKPTIPDPTPQPPESPTPTPQDPEDWNVDEQKEYVTITYMVDDPNKDGINYYQHKKETYLAGTDITMVNPPRFYENDDIGTEYEFIGWFLTKFDTEFQLASGLLGTSGDHYLLCTDTIVYAVYTDAPDLGITANDIYGVIKTGSQFTSSATIVNHKNSSITPSTHINAVLTVKEGNTVVQTIVVEDIVVPGNGTQMISAVVSTADDKSTTGKNETWDNLKTYTLTWSLDFTHSSYVDKDARNNKSSLNSFKPNTYSSIVNTARPGYSTSRPSDYKDTSALPTSNTAFAWEYWVWNERKGYNGTFDSDLSTPDIDPVRGSDKMNVVILLTPENSSGLRTYTQGAFGFHNYTTRSGYGLSMHRTYDDMTGKWAAKKSHITLSSNVGTLEALMMLPEFNYNDTYNTSAGATQKYKKLTVANAGTYYSLTMPQYKDYETDDFNDQFAHYTPMWLPNGEYKPVTHISGMWTPIGELRATIQQGQYTSVNDMNKYGIYTNEVIIKGSLYDDLYNNP